MGPLNLSLLSQNVTYQEKSGHALVGTKVMRSFQCKLHLGAVLSYNDETSYYRVMYGDGGHEDCTFDEVIERRNIYIKSKEKSKQSTVIKKKRPSTHRHKAKKLSKLSK